MTGAGNPAINTSALWVKEPCLQGPFLKASTPGRYQPLTLEYELLSRTAQIFRDGKELRHTLSKQHSFSEKSET